MDSWDTVFSCVAEAFSAADATTWIAGGVAGPASVRSGPVPRASPDAGKGIVHPEVVLSRVPHAGEVGDGPTRTEQAF